MGQGWVLECMAGCWRAGLDSGDRIFVAPWESIYWGSVEQNLVGTMRQGLFKTSYGAGSCRRYSYGGESWGAPRPAQGDVLCKHVVPAAGKVLNIPKTT